jgi:hypothetical protein
MRCTRLTVAVGIIVEVKNVKHFEKWNDDTQNAHLIPIIWSPICGVTCIFPYSVDPNETIASPIVQGVQAAVEHGVVGDGCLKQEQNPNGWEKSGEPRASEE